jgi:hypothetical protein
MSGSTPDEHARAQLLFSDENGKLLKNERAAMAKAKPLIDIKSSRFQEGYKGSTEALPPMRTAPAASVVVKVRPTAPANTNQR